MSLISSGANPFLTLKVSVVGGYSDKCSLTYFLLMTRQNLSLKCHYKLILKPFHEFYNEIFHVSTKEHPCKRVLQKRRR